MVWLLPLAWGSTWLLDNGRVTGLVVWGVVFGWWMLGEPEGTYVPGPRRRRGDPPHVARHRRPARRDRKRRGMP